MLDIDKIKQRLETQAKPQSGDDLRIMGCVSLCNDLIDEVERLQECIRACTGAIRRAGIE